MQQVCGGMCSHLSISLGWIDVKFHQDSTKLDKYYFLPEPNALRIDPGAIVSEDAEVDPEISVLGIASVEPVSVCVFALPRYNTDTNPVDRRKNTSTKIIATFLIVDVCSMPMITSKMMATS